MWVVQVCMDLEVMQTILVLLSCRYGWQRVLHKGVPETISTQLYKTRYIDKIQSLNSFCFHERVPYIASNELLVLNLSLMWTEDYLTGLHLKLWTFNWLESTMYIPLTQYFYTWKIACFIPFDMHEEGMNDIAKGVTC